MGRAAGNAFVSGAGGLRFKSRAGQIGKSAPNGLPAHNCENSSKGAVLPAGTMTWRGAPQTRYSFSVVYYTAST